MGFSLIPFRIGVTGPERSSLHETLVRPRRCLVKKFKIIAATLLALCVTAMPALTGTQASAQAAFPSRPVNFMIPYPPGGWFDSVSRPMCDYSGKALGQPV